LVLKTPSAVLWISEGNTKKEFFKIGTQPSIFCPVDGEGRKTALGTEVQKWKHKQNKPTPNAVTVRWTGNWRMSSRHQRGVKNALPGSMTMLSRQDEHKEGRRKIGMSKMSELSLAVTETEALR
jgi:hypothetical protein